MIRPPRVTFVRAADGQVKARTGGTRSVPPARGYRLEWFARPFDSGRSSRKRSADGRCAVGVGGLDGLQTPGLALLPLVLGPGDQRPVGREDEAGERVAQLDTVAAG